MDKKDKQKNTTPLTSWRAFAGLYLIYSAYELVPGIVSGESENIAVSVISSILFGATGILLTVVEIKKAVAASKNQKTEDSAEATDEQVPENTDENSRSEEASSEDNKSVYDE